MKKKMIEINIYLPDSILLRALLGLVGGFGGVRALMWLRKIIFG